MIHNYVMGTPTLTVTVQVLQEYIINLGLLSVALRAVLIHNGGQKKQPAR